MRQKKKFESELNFCSNKLTDSTLASPRTFRVAMVSAPTLPKFQAYRLRIYVVYTSYFLRILLLISLPLPPFFQNFFLFYMVYSWNFFQNFFRSIQYICSIFLEIFQNFSRIFFYIYYICRGFFQNFFRSPLLNFLKFFSLYSIYVVVFWNFFLYMQYICSIYVVYMQYICSSFSFCLTSYYAHHPLGRRAMTIRSEFRELRSLHSSPSWSIRTKVLGFFYIVLYIVYTQYICSIICSILFFI